MTTQKMEILVAELFRPRQNLVIPNVSWGFGVHECDLLIVSGTGYLTEVEIKISKSDLKKDKDKRHNHKSDKIKNLYFAVPEKLSDCTDLIPDKAGIIVVYPTINRDIDGNSKPDGNYRRWQHAKITRRAETNKFAKPITEAEKYQLARLGALRIWDLKRKLLEKSENEVTT